MTAWTRTHEIIGGDTAAARAVRLPEPRMVVERGNLRETITAIRKAWRLKPFDADATPDMACVVTWEAVAALCDAAESTLPEVQMTDVWRVEYCYFDPDLHITSLTYVSEREAGHRAARMREEPKKYLCVHVTGPHRQEIPA